MKIIHNKKSLKSHDFLKELSICCDKTNSHLRRLLPPKSEEKLYDAINYAIFSGGKRFRAFLVIQAAKLFEIPIVRAPFFLAIDKACTVKGVFPLAEIPITTSFLIF